jgi:hypothetical protein
MTKIYHETCIYVSQYARFQPVQHLDILNLKQYLPLVNGRCASPHLTATTVASQHTDYHTLNFQIAVNVDRLHTSVCRLKSDPTILTVEPFQSCGTIFQKRNHNIPIAGGGALFRNDHIAVGDVIFNHGITPDPQHKSLRPRCKKVPQVDMIRVFNRLDWLARGDGSDQRKYSAAA